MPEVRPPTGIRFYLREPLDIRKLAPRFRWVCPVQSRWGAVGPLRLRRKIGVVLAARTGLPTKPIDFVLLRDGAQVALAAIEQREYFNNQIFEACFY